MACTLRSDGGPWPPRARLEAPRGPLRAAEEEALLPWLEGPADEGRSFRRSDLLLRMPWLSPHQVLRRLARERGEVESPNDRRDPRADRP